MIFQVFVYGQIQCANFNFLWRLFFGIVPEVVGMAHYLSEKATQGRTILLTPSDYQKVQRL